MNLILLLLPLVLFILGNSASAEGVRWPIAQAVLPPELRGSGQAFAIMVSGFINSIMLILSGFMVDQLGGIAPMLLFIFPVPVIIGLFAWLPLFRYYPADHEALHQKLAQRRAELMNRR